MDTKITEKLFSLFRVSTINLVASCSILTIFALHGILEFKYSLTAIIIISIITVIFFWPYIKDLYSLIDYVKKLANDNKTNPPTLNHIKINKLSDAINDLNKIWISKQYELEAQILENKILFDTLPDIIIMLNDLSKIIRINTEASKNFGVDIIGKDIKSVIDNQIIYDHIGWIMQDKKSKKIEIFIENLQKYFMVRISKFPSLNSDSISIILVFTDISEAKRTEKMFSDFVANASHEIRTPLSSIKGFVEILQTTAKDDEAVKDKFLQIIAEQAERLDLLVKDLLSLSKLEMDGNSNNFNEINFENIMTCAHKDLKFMREEKNITFEFPAFSNIPIIHGNSDQLMQVFINLFSNAIKYSYENSIVKIKWNIIENTNSESNSKNLLKIQIIDQSEGIDPKYLPRLTERFYRIDSARIRNNKIGGTGLGLAIVKQIISHHQGTLLIESKLGEGSIFSVCLPILNKI